MKAAVYDGTPVIKLVERQIPKVGPKDAWLGTAFALGNIGLLNKATGDLVKSLECQEEAMRIFQKIGYRRGEAISETNIGVILRV